MKAAFITSLGTTDVLQVGEVPMPESRVGATLVRVEAVGLNWLDVLLRTEDFGLTFPLIPGSDVVGIVEQTQRQGFKRGDRVVINPAIPCGKCHGEDRNPDACRFVRILGVHSAGGYGSLVAVPDAQVYPVPPGLTPIEAAAFPLDYLTAWRMLVTKADLHAGESVLVWGASGALGTAAIRVAKSLGAVVIAAAGSPAFADRLLQIGADHAVLYKSERVADRVKEMTGGAGADCVFESIGAATFEISMNAVRPFGRIVICGTRSGNCATTNLEDLYYNQIRVLGSRMGSKSEFEEVLRRVSQPELRPVIADELSIDDVRAAHALMEQRRHVGKIVLRHE